MLQDEKPSTWIKNFTPTPEDVNKTDANIVYYFATQKKILPVEMFCFPALKMVFPTREK